MEDSKSRARALLAEFDRTIAPQKLQLETLLPNVWKATYGAPQSIVLPASAAPPHAAAAVKAPEAPPAAVKRDAPHSAPIAPPATKRARNDETDRRLDQILKSCLLIVTKKLWNIRAATWFKEPVDPAKHHIPNYFTYVKKPMDLGTIKTKLQSGSYRSPMDFKADVDLVWGNCAIYNQEGTQARIAGDTCKEVWQRAWKESQIEQTWQQMQYELDPAGAPLQERLGALNTQLLKALDQLPGSNQPEGRGRDMTFAEKRRLSTRLGSAPIALTQQLMDVVAEDAAAAGPGAEGGEIELTLDQLGRGTLWKLQELLERPASSKPVPAAVAAAHQQHRPATGLGKQGAANAAAAAAAAGGSSRPAAGPLGAAGGSSRAAAMSTAEKSLPNRERAERNGATSPHSSGGGSESGSGDGGHSSHEVKGSTMDDPHQGGTFVRDGANHVDESATNPKEQSQFIKDRAAARKADVNINKANWDLDLPPTDSGALDVQAEGDDVWRSFLSIAEQKQKREEQQKHEAAQQEQQRRLERERQKQEEDMRQRQLREEEDRQVEEVQRQRDAQMKKELEEIKAQAGTANLTQDCDPAMLATLSCMSAPTGPGGQGLTALGLGARDDDDDMNFEDD